MKEHELLWAMLPEGLEPYFEIEDFQKRDKSFRILLIEKNEVPSDLPTQFKGKRVVNTLIKTITIDDFPIRGRKGELIFKRRAWQFAGLKELFKRDLKIRSLGTKLEKEFGSFLKEFGRKCPDALEPGGLVQRYTSKDVYETIQESS